MAFPSVYEMFVEDLTTVRKQHFWEYFSGSKLQEHSQSVYSQTVNNDEMQMASNEDVRVGQKITSASNGMVGESVSQITVNLKRNYSTTESYNITAYVWDSSGGVRATGNSITYNSLPTGGFNDYTFTFSSPVVVANGDVVGVGVNGGTTGSTSVNVKLNSSSVENTSVLYSWRSGAWFTNHFGGNANMYLIASIAGGARWTQRNISGTGTFDMYDTVNGGVRVLTQAATDSNVSLDFGDIRQYSPTASEIIYVGRRTDSSTRASFGLTNVAGVRATNFVDYVDDTNNTYKQIRSADATTISQTTSTSEAIGFVIETTKLTLGASNVDLLINGVTSITKSTNLPISSTKLQPSVDALTRDGSANGLSVTYCEAYNT
tara:strand:+ start:606 stop:1733 length:1128 start_codon:yes stop_codon:yes gene_type:complete